MTEDLVRVLRIIEYVGPRSLIEKQLSRSLHGTKQYSNGVRINVATIGEFPEILERASAAEAGSQEVHHINGDPLDNRPENLRVVPRENHD